MAQCLYQQATTPGNVGASIFWLKARAGWREKHAVEVSGPEGKPIEPAKIVYAWYPGDPLLEGPIEGDRR